MFDPRNEMRFRRYCDRAFPAYRFTPGHTPHPTQDPRGHSYIEPNAVPPRVERFPVDRWHESADYRFGCDLYNHGYFWEAHEAWEGLWHAFARESSAGRFLQGLIQTVAAQLKLHLGRFDGVRRLRESSASYLRSVAEETGDEVYMGLRISKFLTGLDAYFGSGVSEPPARRVHEAAFFPYLRLELPPAEPKS